MRVYLFAVWSDVCECVGLFAERVPFLSRGRRGAPALDAAPSWVHFPANESPRRLQHTFCSSTPAIVTTTELSYTLLCMWVTCSVIPLLTEVSPEVSVPILFGLLHRSFYMRRPSPSVPIRAVGQSLSWGLSPEGVSVAFAFLTFGPASCWWRGCHSERRSGACHPKPKCNGALLATSY